MSEYIEREAAVAKITELINQSGKYTDYECGADDACFIVNHISATEVRPVVLCRDCDCWNDWDSAGKESLGNYVCSCAHWTVEDGVVFYTRPTDFCSYGEKREES